MQPKSVVVTGASSGIGAAAALRLSRDGHSVTLVARRADALQAVAAECGPTARAIAADMTERDDVQRVLDEAVAAAGRVDVWINNVGQGITRLPSQLTDADIDDVMRVNVKSALYGMQVSVSHFQSSGDGHVINVSSMLGRIPYATARSAYCGAKHFLNALTATFREEVQATHSGIQFSLVSPGVVYTNFGRNAMHGGPDSRQLPDGQTPEEVADVIAWVVATRPADVYTRAGCHARVVNYYSSIATDPEVARR